MPPEIQPNAGRDLMRIHKVITRALVVTVETTQGAGPAPELRPGFHSYVRALVSLLHAHHTGEDEIAFPFWRERLPEGPFDLLSSHHRAMIPVLDRIGVWVALDSGAWEAAALTWLSRDLSALQALWRPHIVLEEATVGEGPSAERLSPAENAQLAGELAAHGTAHAQPAELVMPFILYNLPAADRESFARVLPPIVTQQLVPGPWRAAWAPMTPFLLE